MEVADGIHRFGTRMVNWYLIERGAASPWSTPACAATGPSSPTR